MKIHKPAEEHIAYQSADEVSEICKPLFEHFDMNYFAYFRIYHDQKMMGLLSDHEWFKYFIDHGHVYQNGKKLNAGLHLWDNTFSEEMLHDAKEHYDHEHGLYIISENKDYTESVVFATNAGNHDVFNAYFNQTEKLKQFAFYFKNKAARLIEQSEKQPIYFDKPLHANAESEVELERFAEKLYLDEYVLATSNGCVTITPREFECTLLLADGKTAKEIARILNISHRTVESYLLHVRKKLDCHSKAEIVEILRRNQLILGE